MQSSLVLIAAALFAGGMLLDTQLAGTAPSTGQGAVLAQAPASR